MNPNTSAARGSSPRSSAPEPATRARQAGGGSAADVAEPAFSERICATIKQYWRIRGVTVKAWCERQMMDGAREIASDHRVIFAIKSEGIPVRRA